MQNNMITEDYVSYETAKLLKEKGFDVWGNGSYDSGIEIYKEYSPSGLLNSCATSKPHLKGYPAPTLQMAMKWLRENYNIYYDIGYDDCDWFWNIISVDKNVPVEDRPLFIKNGLAGYKSYEDACETAIKYCLENLI